ncbi:MAG: hypothetical protein JWP25_7574 [Bradyrhizobium sp.]|nr:hypothetical protein [Bradyrhizobium sp.]
MDSILDKAAACRAAVSLYWAKAQGFVATTTGKAVVALLVVGALAGYAHHLGAESASAKLTVQVEQLKKQLADAQAAQKPEVAPPNFEQEHADADLSARLSESEEAKKVLEKKVADYEKQLAQGPAKAGGFILSPADARGLSNIK